MLRMPRLGASDFTFAYLLRGRHAVVHFVSKGIPHVLQCSGVTLHNL